MFVDFPYCTQLMVNRALNGEFAEGVMTFGQNQISFLTEVVERSEKIINVSYIFKMFQGSSRGTAMTGISQWDYLMEDSTFISQMEKKYNLKLTSATLDYMISRVLAADAEESNELKQLICQKLPGACYYVECRIKAANSQLPPVITFLQELIDREMGDKLFLKELPLEISNGRMKELGVFLITDNSLSKQEISDPEKTQILIKNLLIITCKKLLLDISQQSTKQCNPKLFEDQQLSFFRD